MNNNMNKFEENNKNVNVNEQEAQVENKKSVLKVVKDCLTNKYTLIGLGIVALGGAGYYGWKKWAKKDAQQAPDKKDGFEDVAEK